MKNFLKIAAAAGNVIFKMIQVVFKIIIAFLDDLLIAIGLYIIYSITDQIAPVVATYFLGFIFLFFGVVVFVKRK